MGRKKHKLKHGIRKVLKKRAPNRSLLGDVFILIMLLAIGAFLALPLVLVISNAFKPLDEIFLFPPRFFVRNPTMNNFRDLLVLMSNSWVPFTRYFFNTVFMTAVGTAGHVIVASMAAYALEKHGFPGSKIFFKIIITTLMFSPVVTAIPNYLTMSKIGFLDSYLSIIIPAFGFPLGLFLMKQFMVNVPNSLIESARLDGASEWKILWKVVMPMVKPAWLTLVIFSFQGLWNATGGTYIYSEELKTLPYALNQIRLGGIARQGTGAAVQLLMLIVPVTMFIITQSNIIETMASSGLKE